MQLSINCCFQSEVMMLVEVLSLPCKDLPLHSCVVESDEAIISLGVKYDMKQINGSSIS